MSHLRLVHSSDETSISYPIDAVYSKSNSMLSHIYRKHRTSIIRSSENSDVSAGVISDEYDVHELASSGILSLPSVVNHDVDILLSRDVHAQKKNY